MNEENKLINIDLQIQQNKDNIDIAQGFKLYLFEALYLVQQYHGNYKFIEIILTIFEFLQLMAFPFDKVFNETWGVHWIKTIGNYFRFTQLIYLWQRSTFIFIAYILTCIYIIIFITLCINVITKSTKFISVLNIPMIKILFSIFSCKNGNLEIYSEIKCKSAIHYLLILISIVLVIIFKILTLIIHTTLYEFGTEPNKLTSGYSSTTNVMLDIIELILIIIYQFISHQLALILITLFISILILIHFLIAHPFSNEFAIKLYLSLYALFCWTCILCIITIFLKDSEFRSGIILLILIYPFILIIIYMKKFDFSIEKLFSFYFDKTQDGYYNILDIEYFLKIEESLTGKMKTDKFKFIFFSVSNYERNCIDNNCYLKSFLKIPLKKENFSNLRFFLLQHAQTLYKEAISKYPNNIKLRISYIIFLIKKLNKFGKAKSEIYLINKFETNFECSFLIYKIKRFFFDDKKQLKVLDNNNEISQSLTNRLKSNEVLNFIKNIIKKYISFWNILLNPEWTTTNNFIKMSKLGEEINSLKKNLGKIIKLLHSWNLLEQETIKLYVDYLKEIINNNEEAAKYNNQISENELNVHHFDEINLYNLDYQELSKTEDYKYIIINYSRNDFNKINNISFSVCKLLGYTKEELIGRTFNILFPELYINEMKLFMNNKLEEFNQNLLIKNKNINSDICINEFFGLHKAKYLIQFKAKCSLIFTNDDKIYGIWSLLPENKKMIKDKKQELVYVLTDKNLIIQYFSSNAHKILQLNLNNINNNYCIKNNINVLNENFNSKIQTKNNEEEYIKNKIIRRKSNYDKQEISQKINHFGINPEIVIHWKNNENSENNNIKEIKNINYTFLKSSSINYYLNALSKNHEKGKNLDNGNQINKGFNFTTIQNHDINQCKYMSEVINKEHKDEQKPTENLFYMKIEDVKYNERKIGYIFIFKPFIHNKENGKKENISNESKDLISNFPEYKNINLSEISLISFEDEKQKPNNNESMDGEINIVSQNIDSFFKNTSFERKNQFTFNINDMTFKQFKYENNKYSLYDTSKDKALKKLTNIRRELQPEESEEEEESSESDYISDENNSEEDSKKNSHELTSPKKENNHIKEEITENSQNSDNISKIKVLSSKKTVNQNLIQSTLKSNKEINKKKEEDFYHVNFNKISFYVFNYSTGYAELQKGQNYKISHVTYLINSEKEKLKNSNSKFLSNAKFMKGKKKGNIIKKEENEVNFFSITSLKLKEIYKILSTHSNDDSIIKMLYSSLVIFILILGMSFMNIIIYYYIKNNINTFLILIEKSGYLYHNMLFEFTIVKEMLFVNNPFYNITLNRNKTLYYESLANQLYNNYIENNFIISNLTTNFNILNKKDEDVLTKRFIELSIIDPARSIYSGYTYRKYNVLVYSAYKEMNSALYHISQLSLEDIYQYDDDVYYFMRNGLSNLIMSCEDQMLIIIDKFSEKIESGKKLIIICCYITFFVCCVCLFIFAYFYRNVTKKKHNYLSIFEQLDINLIILSLQKCEKFINKLLKTKQDKYLKNRKISSNNSSVNFSDKENDNLAFLNNKNKKGDKIMKSNDEKIIKHRKIKNKNIFQYIIFLIIFICQLVIYIYYYRNIIIYKNICIYEYYVSIFAAHFINIFVAFREFMFDRKSILYNETVEDFLNNQLPNYYNLFSQKSKIKDIYRIYYPDSYQVFLNYLYSSKICEFIDIYISEYPENIKIDCNNFFYGTPKYGFWNVLSIFVEEIRLMKDKIDYYFSVAEKKNFVYNETYFNDPKGNYEKLYMKYADNLEEYKKYNPANFLNNYTHKKLLITHLYINTQVYSFLIKESLNQFEEVFDKYNFINLTINILFIIFVFIGFIFIWIPFIFYENNTLNKIKNLLSILPSDLLIDLHDINNILGIE